MSPLVPELRYGLHFQCCLIKCLAHWSIKEVRSIKIMGCHTHPYCDMQWITFLCRMRFFLFKNTFLLGEERWHIHHWKEPLITIQHLRTCDSLAGFLVPIYLSIWQFINKSEAIRPHIEVFLHEVLHSWHGTQDCDNDFPCNSNGKHSPEAVVTTHN